MTKSKGIGRGRGGGRPAKEQKRIVIPVAVNADRVGMYKEYLSVMDGGRVVEDKDVAGWLRTILYGELAQLDDLVDKQVEQSYIF